MVVLFWLFLVFSISVLVDEAKAWPRQRQEKVSRWKNSFRREDVSHVLRRGLVSPEKSNHGASHTA